MRIPLTFDPVRVHLNDLVNQLNGEPAFPLGLADLLRISSLVVDEVQHVQSHGGRLLPCGASAAFVNSLEAVPRQALVSERVPWILSYVVRREQSATAVAERNESIDTCSPGINQGAERS